MTSSPLASRSVNAHYSRGVLGLLSLLIAIIGAAAEVPAALALLIVTVAAWRGCPTCWAIGLMQTREGAVCRDGRCRRAQA